MKKNDQKKIKTLSPEKACSIALAAQGLDRNSPFGKGKNGVLGTIKQLSYVQLDTLAVVARAHHHTLWSRSADYSEKHLHDLIREKKVFEYWSHAAAFLPMEDFRFSLLRKQEFLDGKSHWFQKNKKIMQYVLDRIRAEGPLQAKDFETDRKRGSWFDWKPAKIALEQLFHDGTLMVSERKGFQKVYDLAERIIPAGTDTHLPSKEEYADYLIRSAIRAHGLASVKDMTHLRKGMLAPVSKRLHQLQEENEIEKIAIEGIDETFYTSAISQGPNRKSKIANRKSLHILSPFDNAIIRRERLLRLFDYDFAIECYLPEPKRKFGYFCLPVLYNEKFVGRFDPKADRQNKTLIVKKLYVENPPEDLDEFLDAFAGSLREFAGFNGCEKIVVEKVVGGKWKRDLEGRLK